MASASASAAKKVLKEASVIDARGQTDTIRLWENYRDQALLWRAIALLQIPATTVALIFSLFIWYNRTTVLHVPAKPLPGIYAAQEIPDTEFINVATEYVNLVGTYQPAVAKRQYQKARELLKEPMLTNFDRDMMDIELKAIETTNRTQIFFVDPTKTEIIREGADVHIRLTGERLKMVAGKELPLINTKYTISLTTIPRNTTNPYGIVVTNATSENIQN